MSACGWERRAFRVTVCAQVLEEEKTDGRKESQLAKGRGRPPSYRRHPSFNEYGVQPAVLESPGDLLPSTSLEAASGGGGHCGRPPIKNDE